MKTQIFELKPIDSFPEDGKFYLCFDKNLEPKILNKPKGYSIGLWHRNKDNTWGGSCVSSYFIPLWWCEVPRVKKPEQCK